MARYHSEAWSTEMPIGGDNLEPSWYYIREREEANVCAMYAGDCRRLRWVHLGEGRIISLPKPIKPTKAKAVRKISNNAFLLSVPFTQAACCKVCRGGAWFSVLLEGGRGKRYRFRRSL